MSDHYHNRLNEMFDRVKANEYERGMRDALSVVFHLMHTDNEIGFSRAMRIETQAKKELNLEDE